MLKTTVTSTAGGRCAVTALASPMPLRPSAAGTDDLLGGMGSGQLSAGTRQRVHRRDRRDGHRRRRRPWPDFQTKTFAELNAKGDAYDMVVGDSQWLGAASTGGHYVDLTDFVKEQRRRQDLRAGDAAVLLAVRRQVLVDPARGRRQRLGLSQGLVRGSRTRWPPSRPSTATTSACRRTSSSCVDIAEFFTRPDREPLRRRALHPDRLRRAWRWASSRRSSPMAAISATTRPSKVDGILNSPQNDRGARGLPQALQLHAAELEHRRSSLENNQAFTEGLVAMSMNYFAFFPALANEATNPHAEGHRLLRQPARPERQPARGARRPGHLDRLLLQEPGRGLQVPRVVHPDDVQKKWAELGGYTCSAAVLELRRVPQRHAVQRGLLPVDEDREGLLGGAGLCRHAVPDERPAASLHHRRARATAKEALDGLAADWNATLAKLKPERSEPYARAGGNSPARASKPQTQTGGSHVAVVATLDPVRGRPARGWSDLTIRNLFILPTIAFLIIFNIFPLIYSLGFSFTEYPRVAQQARRLRRPAELSRPACRSRHLEQLHHHRAIRDRLGRRPDDRRLRARAAAQPRRSR